MKYTSCPSLLLTLVLTVVASSSMGATLLNGSFEDNRFADDLEQPARDIKGWKIISTNFDDPARTPWGVGNGNRDGFGKTVLGEQYIVLPDFNSEEVGIAQEVNDLVVGQDYELTFRIGNFNQTVQSLVHVRDEQGWFDVKAEGLKPGEGVFGWKEGGNQPIEWATVTISFRAERESNVFHFTGLRDRGWAALDGVELNTVMAVPEPSRALLMALSGMGLTLRRRRARA